LTATTHAAVESVHALIGALWLERRRTAHTQRFRMMRETAAYEERLLDRELQELGGVLSGEDPHTEALADPVYSAALYAADAGGLTVREATTNHTGFARLQAIGAASHVAVRTVALIPQWWTTEIPPFVAFVGSDAQPIAVVPAKRGGYDRVDPRTGQRIPIDASVAATLPVHVHTLLRPFPPRHLDVRTLLGFGLRGSRRDSAITVVLGLAGAMLAGAIPPAIALLFDTVVPAADRNALIVVTVALILFACVATTLEFARGMLIVRIQARLTTALQLALMDRLLSLPAPFFRAFGVGDLASRVTGVDQIDQYLSDVTVSGALGGIFSVISLALIFVYAPSLLAICLLLGLVTIAVLTAQAVVASNFAREIANRNGRISNDVLQMIDGVAKLRVAHAEIRAFARWLAEFAAQRRVIVASARVSNAFAIFGQTWPLIAGLALITWVVEADRGSIDAGAFLAVSAALGQFVAGVFGLGSAAAMAARAIPIYQRARPFLDATPERQEHRRDPSHLSGAVALHDVSFRYTPTGKPALDAITLDVQPGEFVAIVGPSGSGKSTLLRLLLGFEQPESGSVLYGTQDLATLDAGAVRRQIGTVLQSTQLMPGSIYDNIAAGRMITQTEAWEAARAVGLDAEIAAMPMQMQTYIGGAGGTFSGGQRQRIAIARAIATHPRLLYFDEATSALDNATQAIVSATLAQLHVTRIVIAHRLSTIIDADRIVVIDGGRIVQTGSYAELLVQAGPFARLAQRQIV
jgi:NHLM bacteriocin system ABC transporter ATP-binding protein